MRFATRRHTGRAVLAALAMALSSNAHSSVNWDWTFENVASVQPQDTVYVRATLFNDSSSTEPLDMPFMFAGVSFDSPLLGGQFNNAYPSMGFGHGDASPFTTFYPFITSQVLQPGQAVSFDFIWFSPQAGGAPAGTYTTFAEIRVCLDGRSDCAMQEAKNHSLSWTVAAVPEPGTTSLMFLGLLAAGVAVRRRSSSSQRTVSRGEATGVVP
jgi:hypothetical protein